MADERRAGTAPPVATWPRSRWWPTSCAAARRATSSPTSSTATSTSPTCASSTARFCAFSRDHREEEGYLLPIDEVVRRAREAWDLGASEVCIQAGLPPKLDGRFYIDLTPRAEGRPARAAPARVLAGRGAVRLGALGALDQGVPDGAEGGRSRHAAGHVRRDPRSGDPGRHRPRPHHREPVGGGDHHRARARDPDDLDHHVRARRDDRALGAAHGAAARHPEGHRRLHRVRAAVAHPQRGADVFQAPGAQRPSRRHRRRT